MTHFDLIESVEQSITCFLKYKWMIQSSINRDIQPSIDPSNGQTVMMQFRGWKFKVFDAYGNKFDLSFLCRLEGPGSLVPQPPVGYDVQMIGEKL